MTRGNRETSIEPLGRPVAGRLRVGGDKSISHRAAILAAVARGASAIRNYSPAGDCAATLEVLRGLGVSVREDGGVVRIEGDGVDGIEEPDGPLDCRRSGTTMRLMAGVLAAAPFEATLTGDPQLLQRPMARVAEPLSQMGARVRLADGDRPPIVVTGGDLQGILYRLPVASAQVKSAILLAGLRAKGDTMVVEPIPSRDHTERLLAWLGAPLRTEREGDERSIRLTRHDLPAFELEVPGDLSSAAPLLAAAAMIPGSDLTVEGVGLNPTRAGFLRALERMGVGVQVERSAEEPEPVGRVRIRHRPLRAVSLGAPDMPAIIDELPLLGLVATQAEGVTEVHGAEELRVKETDRIGGLVRGLRGLGADADGLEDGFAIRGPTPLAPGSCDSLGDHRLAMTFAVAGLAATGPVNVTSMGSVADSFPGFEDAVRGLRG